MGTDRTRPTTDEAERHLLADIAGAKANDGGPAFPCEGGCNSGLIADPGMTLRDYFAAKAMNGMCAANAVTSVDTGEVDDCKDSYLQRLADTAYGIADAMLAARNPTT